MDDKKSPQDEDSSITLKKASTINTNIVTQSITIVNSEKETEPDFDNSLDDFDKICKQAEEFEEGTKSNPKTTNPDFLPVQWHLDFTQVKYELPTGVKGGKEKKVTTLRKFLKAIVSIPEENRPSSTITPLLVVENMLALLNHYNITLKYNIITDDVEIFKQEEKLGGLEDETQFIWDCAEKHSWRLPKERLISLVVALAKKRKYNPIEIYLMNCYDMYAGGDVIAELCDTLESNIGEKRLYIEKFLVQMVALSTSKEESTTAGQYLLVLQGRQGLGKTTWFKNLIPAEMQRKYFLGGRTLDPANKDHIMESATNWLVEMGEIASTFRKADQEMFKSYVTDYKDRYRPPYAKEAVDKKRRTTLCGTTNDNEYLRDETGSRRFLTIPCTNVNYDHNVDLEQLWGQVVSMYMDGYKYWFTPEETAWITQNNEKYKVKSDLQLALELHFELFPADTEDADNPFAGEWLTSKDMAEYIHDNKSTTEQDISPVVVGKTLKKVGVKFKVEKDRNKTTKFLVRKLK